jgi:hypothetical protein
MKLIRFFVSGALAFALAAANAGAQSVVTQSNEKTQAEQEAARARRAALETKAFALLEEAAAEANSLRIAENRARLHSVAAAALWPHDEARARELFQAAVDGVASLASALTADDFRYEQHYHRIQNLRREIVSAVAQREPKLALEFVRGTRLAPPPRAGDTNYYMPDQELALEAQLAALVASRDPREALRIAEESLARGVSGHLSNILERVRQDDPQAASKLAADIVRKLRSSNLAADYDAAGVATYLLHATRPPASAPPPPPPTTPAGIRSQHVALVPANNDARALTLDEATRRDLISLVVGAALGASGDRRGRGNNTAGQLLAALQAALPEVEQLLPAQAPALRRRVSEFENAGGERFSSRPRWQEFEQLMQTGTVDAILQAAGRAPADVRWQLYRRAAAKAVEEGATERARQIVNDSEMNPQQREQLLRELDQMLFWRAANQGDASQALALLARFKSPEERTHMTLTLAQSAAARGNRELAERLLEEVLNQTGVRARNMGLFSTQLQAAHAYANFAPERAFQITEACVEHLNELTAAAVQVDGFGQEAFEQGELKLDGNVWSSLVQQAGELLAALAPKDFERARDVAGRFQRPEARSQAMIAVARGALGSGDLPVNGRHRLRPLTVAPAGRRQ